jgi:hypothetical protein
MTNFLSELDKVIPRSLIEKVTSEFLDEADWTLEIDGCVFEIPRTPPPLLVSRAFVAAHIPEVFCDNHFEAVLALNPELVGTSIVAKAGYIRLYFDSNGRLISDDRIPPAQSG